MLPFSLIVLKESCSITRAVKPSLAKTLTKTCEQMWKWPCSIGVYCKITRSFPYCLLFYRQEASAVLFEEEKVCLLTHVLQCLVFASGIDWAQDEDLLKLTLTIGQLSL